MTIYDGVMALIVVYTVVHGFWRGAAWQIAPIVSLVAGYMIAMPMSVTAAHWFGQPPLNRLFALVTIYLLVSLTVYLFFRSFRQGVEKAQLTEFDRHLGAILGGLKGVLVTLSATGILLIYVPPSREIILKSESSSIASKLISTIYPVLPHAMHVLLEPYLHKLGDQLQIDFQDPHDDDDGFERPTTSARRAAITPQKQTRDDGEFQLEPTSPDDGFEPTIQRSRQTPRTPTPLDDDQFTMPTRRDDYPSREPLNPPTTSRPKRPIQRSAEEDDPFETADPDKAAAKLR
jgi:uncharacterized membrane protein required for colicin V production